MNATIQQMPAAEYFADPCPTPSLSSSIAQVLIAETPLHAHYQHPRYGDAERKSARRAEIGSVAHELALGTGSGIVVINADSFRTKVAQEQRDAAVAAGLVPILAEDYEHALRLSLPLREAVEEYMEAPIKDCLTEHVIMWQSERGGWRRAMIDIIRRDYLKAADLKTTQASVSPSACSRRIFDGYDIQNSFYLDAIDALDPANKGRRKFGFLFAEQSAPYAVSPPIELAESAQEMGRRKVERAGRIWDECVSSNIWPGYSRAPHFAEAPVWAINQELDNE